MLRTQSTYEFPVIISILFIFLPFSLSPYPGCAELAASVQLLLGNGHSERPSWKWTQLQASTTQHSSMFLSFLSSSFFLIMSLPWAICKLQHAILSCNGLNQGSSFTPLPHHLAGPFFWSCLNAFVGDHDSSKIPSNLSHMCLLMYFEWAAS